jgi:hypothetical protein
MPDPQPAWAQAYDVQMQPVWDRALEPPAISGFESQRLCATLIDLHAAFGGERFLDSAERALDYLRRCELEDGTIPRFRALGSDRPIYFRRGPGGRGHVLTFERSALADNYAFVVPSQVEELSRAVRARRAGEDREVPAPPTDDEVRRLLAAQDTRGAWTEAGVIRDAAGRKTRPEAGVLRSDTFARNAHRLCEWLRSRDR